MTKQKVRLTELVSCAGCAAKIGPGYLNGAVKDLFAGVSHDPHVLVGFGTLDDAGVYRLNAHQALVQTVDFITPVVDDPFAYGEVAVANALSDVYAMGGLPLTALNVVCFPSSLDAEILGGILSGGLSKLQEAGVALLGGHTVDDPEIKFGVSVTGMVDPERILTNAGAKVGATLILTKPIGVGVITTGIKQGASPEAAIGAALASMRTLNKAARDAIVSVDGVQACTDVTGFSLMGHLYHMVRASGVTAQIVAAQVPLIAGAWELAEQGIQPGGTQRNKDYFGPHVRRELALDPVLENLLFDPQTSGGLLVSVPGHRKNALLEAFAELGVTATVVGEITAPSAGEIILV